MRNFDETQFNEDWKFFVENIKKIGLAEKFNLEKLEESFKSAPGALTEDTGIAYPGALLRHIVLSTSIAIRLSKMVSNTFSISEESLLKVCLLMHLSKIEMYVKNDNDWEIKNRGMNFRFAQLDGRLKFGERSILLLMKKGISLTPFEFEAIRCIDKKGENENKMAEYFDNILTIIVRQANELAYAIESKR